MTKQMGLIIALFGFVILFVILGENLLDPPDDPFAPDEPTPISRALLTNSFGVTSSTTFVDVPDMSLELESFSVYQGTFVAYYDADGTGAHKWTMTIPTNAAGFHSVNSGQGSGASNLTDTHNVLSNPAITHVKIWIETVDPGTLQLQYAQGGSDPGTSFILEGSSLELEKISP